MPMVSLEIRDLKPNFNWRKLGEEIRQERTTHRRKCSKGSLEKVIDSLLFSDLHANHIRTGLGSCVSLKLPSTVSFLFEQRHTHPALWYQPNRFTILHERRGLRGLEPIPIRLKSFFSVEIYDTGPGEHEGILKLAWFVVFAVSLKVDLEMCFFHQPAVLHPICCNRRVVGSWTLVFQRHGPANLLMKVLDQSQPYAEMICFY